jgi:RNA polymerase sigma-70 factor, ECF subfamily
MKPLKPLLKSLNDRKLLHQARNFDENALAEIYDRWSKLIYRYAMRLLGDQFLAEECVAETFSRFLTALRNSSGPEDHLQAYLFRIAHNWITDIYRKHAPIILPLTEDMSGSSESDPSRIVAEKMDQQKVRVALACLTPDQRQVITLRFIEDWGSNEIARSMGKPVGAIKALQHRGLAALRQILLQEEEHSS